MDLSSLSNEELRAVLVSAGLKPGPITATTRGVWEKKLIAANGSPPKSSSPRKPSPRAAKARLTPEEDDDEEDDDDDQLQGESFHRKLDSPLSARDDDSPFVPRQRRPPPRLYPQLPEDNQETEEEVKSSGFLSFILKLGVGLIFALFLYFLFQRLADQGPTHRLR